MKINLPLKILCQNCTYTLEFTFERTKIKRSIAIRHIREGGINIPDISLYIQALKLTWMKKLRSNSSAKWKSILQEKIPEVSILESFGAQ